MSTGELEAGRPRLPVAAAESTVAIPSPWRIAWRRFLRDRVAVAPVAGHVLRAGAVTGAVAFGGAIMLFLVSITALPIITMVAMDIGTAVGICVYIEAVFRMPGLGYTTIQSMGGSGLDLPMLVGITLFTGTVIIVLNLLVDLIAVVLDPTIRHSPRAGRRPLGLSARTT